MSSIRKAIAQFLTGLATWITAVTVSPAERITSSEWAVLAGGLIGAFLVWLIPNGPQQVELVNEPDDRGAVEPGSCALGLLLGLLIGYLLWKNGGVS